MGRLGSRKKIVRLNETDKRVLLAYSDHVIDVVSKDDSEMKDKSFKFN